MPVHATPLYQTDLIRAIEQGAGTAGLMEKAGLAAATLAKDLLGEDGDSILVIAGPGNNGGDALVAARHLKSWWIKVVVVWTGKRETLPPDAAAALDAWLATGGTIETDIPIQKFDLVIDGLFGIGLERDLAGDYATLVSTINGLDAVVLALDVPSGLASDTGRVRGCAVRADHTTTFIGLKPGLLTLGGSDYCGRIHLCELGLDASAAPVARGAVIGSDILGTVLPARRANSHKGDYGSAGIIGGARGMAGAALLAGRAALQLGTGRVYVGLLDEAGLGYDPAQPEMMLRPAHEILRLDHLSCVAVGPGLGQMPEAHRLVTSALAVDIPMVIDADALNLVAADTVMQQLVAQRAAPTLLTPHPAEAARLLGRDTAALQADRVAAACEIATRYRSAVVLKGAGSVCAMPDGTWFINTSGNPGMASAGMGDVLTGIITALLAQGANAQNALLAAVHMHGAAGDALAIAQGQIGITASECITAARRLFNEAQSRNS